jgi:hypothetical protein
MVITPLIGDRRNGVKGPCAKQKIVMANVRFGSLATEQSRGKIYQCPLLPKSGHPSGPQGKLILLYNRGVRRWKTAPIPSYAGGYPGTKES